MLKAIAGGVTYNDISEDLKNAIPQLKRGQKVKYRVVGSYDVIRKKYKLLSSLHIPATDVIMDPFTDQTVNIAMIERILPTGEPKFVDLWITDATGNVLILNGSNPKHQAIYNFIELCNFNVSNVNRDTSAQPLLEKADDIDMFMRQTQKERARQAAVDVVRSMTNDELIDYWKKTIDPNIANSVYRNVAKKEIDTRYLEYMRARTEVMASENPSRFIGTEKSKMDDEYISARIKVFKDRGMIKVDMRTGTWKYADDEVITKFNKRVGVQPAEELKRFFMGQDEGKKAFVSLDKMITG
jgi:hypothetical protein